MTIEHRIKDRSPKLDKRRRAMPADNRRSIRTLQEIIVKRGQQARHPERKP